ncbi:unnamed protein product [Gadus morhua 'NCC']
MQEDPAMKELVSTLAENFKERFESAPKLSGSQGGPKGHGGPGGQESRGGPGGQEKGPRAWGPRSAEAGLGATESRGGPGGQEKGPRAWVRWRAEAPTGLRVHMKSSLPPPVAGSGSSVAR